MEKTPSGTSVGVEDPYAHVERCDHLTDDGRCRVAIERPSEAPEFARERAEDGYRCPVADPEREMRTTSERASGERRVAERSEATDGASGGQRERGERCRMCERGAKRAVSGDAASSDPRAGERAWQDCPQMSSRSHDRECVRCGLAERRMAHTDDRPLLQEHHLTYPDDDRREVNHEVTVPLCRWCHAKVHDSWARLDDDASPDPEALAEHEGRRSRELDELGFETAAERADRD